MPGRFREACYERRWALTNHLGLLALRSCYRWRDVDRCGDAISGLLAHAVSVSDYDRACVLCSIIDCRTTFAAKVEIGGTIGVFTVTIGGAAALWLGALVVFNAIYPESAIEMAGPYKLRLNLLFPLDNPPNPLSEAVKVNAYVQHQGQAAEAIDPSLRLDRGVGGLVVNFDNLQLGDKLYLITEDGNHKWRSDDMVTPTAQVQMNPIASNGQQ